MLKNVEKLKNFEVLKNEEKLKNFEVLKNVEVLKLWLCFDSGSLKMVSTISDLPAFKLSLGFGPRKQVRSRSQTTTTPAQLLTLIYITTTVHLDYCKVLLAVFIVDHLIG